MSRFLAERRADLYRLKRLVDLDEVELRTARLKHRGLLPHALKYGLWALRPGGRLIVRDSGPAGARLQAFEIPFGFVRQAAGKLLSGAARLTDLDDRAFTLAFERTSEPPPPGWSAGVVFSGAEAELPVLRRCLDGLAAQPELAEIVVCGPPRDLTFLAGVSKARYLDYEVATQPRLLICAKKNALARSLTQPRLCLLHARNVLAPGCLAAFPREFDLSAPQGAYGTLPYLDLAVTDAPEGWRPPRRLVSRNDYPRDDYLRLYERGTPWLDGGLFMARREAFMASPLHEGVAWGEAEDLEWCWRAQAQGFLVDLEPAAHAQSQTFKWPRRMLSQPRFTRAPVRALAWTAAWLRDRLERLAGRR